MCRIDAAALRLHPRHDLPARAHARHHVDVERDLPAGFVVGDAEARRVVDQHVDAPERRVRALEERVELRGLRHVGGLRVHLHALGGAARSRSPRAPPCRARRSRRCAPSSANASAVARPMPRLPPVITTPLPRSPRSMVLPQLASSASRSGQSIDDCAANARSKSSRRSGSLPLRNFSTSLRELRRLRDTRARRPSSTPFSCSSPSASSNSAEQLVVVLEEVLGEHLLGHRRHRRARERLAHPLRLALARLTAQEHRAQPERAGRGRERDLLDGRRLLVDLGQERQGRLRRHAREDLVGPHGPGSYPPRARRPGTRRINRAVAAADETRPGRRSPADPRKGRHGSDPKHLRSRSRHAGDRVRLRARAAGARDEARGAARGACLRGAADARASAEGRRRRLRLRADHRGRGAARAGAEVGRAPSP